MSHKIDNNQIKDVFFYGVNEFNPTVFVLQTQYSLLEIFKISTYNPLKTLLNIQGVKRFTAPNFKT